MKKSFTSVKAETIWVKRKEMIENKHITDYVIPRRLRTLALSNFLFPIVSISSFYPVCIWWGRFSPLQFECECGFVLLPFGFHQIECNSVSHFFPIFIVRFSYNTKHHYSFTWRIKKRCWRENCGFNIFNMIFTQFSTINEAAKPATYIWTFVNHTEVVCILDGCCTFFSQRTVILNENKRQSVFPFWL